MSEAAEAFRPRPPLRVLAGACPGGVRAGAHVVDAGRIEQNDGPRTITPPQEIAMLGSKRILMFVADVYEDLEVWYPRLRLVEAGAKVVLAGPADGATYAGKHGYPCRSDAAIADVRAADFEGLVVPGGFMPDLLRRDQQVLQLVRDFDAAGKLIAAVCHGGWIPISAGVYRGVRVTGSLGIKDDLINAGAIWEDAPVVIDRHFVSSRKPDDLPEFCKGILEVLAGQN